MVFTFLVLAYPGCSGVVVVRNSFIALASGGSFGLSNPVPIVHEGS